MHVVTYFEHMPQLYADANHALLRNAWERTWGAYGVVETLSPGNAQSHPRYQALIDHTASFPSITPRAYDIACYVRWCAAAELARQVGKIVFMDYDVFPTTRFEGFPQQSQFAEFGHIPTCVTGYAEDFDRILDTFLAYRVPFGQKHINDMLILRANPHIFDTHCDWTLCYGEPGWTRKPLVHLGNSYMPVGRTRIDVLAEAQKLNIILS